MIYTDVGRQFAINAARCFRAGEFADGEVWLQAFVARYSDVFTERILKAMLASEYDEVASLLEHQIRWCL